MNVNLSNELLFLNFPFGAHSLCTQFTAVHNFMMLGNSKNHFLNVCNIFSLAYLSEKNTFYNSAEMFSLSLSGWLAPLAIM